MLYGIRHELGPAWSYAPAHLVAHFPMTVTPHFAAQENERKQKQPPKESPEELAECEAVFADF